MGADGCGAQGLPPPCICSARRSEASPPLAAVSKINCNILAWAPAIPSWTWLYLEREERFLHGSPPPPLQKGGFKALKRVLLLGRAWSRLFPAERLKLQECFRSLKTWIWEEIHRSGRFRLGTRAAAPGGGHHACSKANTGIWAFPRGLCRALLGAATAGVWPA